MRGAIPPLPKTRLHAWYVFEHTDKFYFTIPGLERCCYTILPGRHNGTNFMVLKEGPNWVGNFRVTNMRPRKGFRQPMSVVGLCVTVLIYNTG